MRVVSGNTDNNLQYKPTGSFPISYILTCIVVYFQNHKEQLEDALTQVQFLLYYLKSGQIKSCKDITKRKHVQYTHSEDQHRFREWIHEKQNQTLWECEFILLRMRHPSFILHSINAVIGISVCIAQTATRLLPELTTAYLIEWNQRTWR